MPAVAAEPPIGCDRTTQIQVGIGVPGDADATVDLRATLGCGDRCRSGLRLGRMHGPRGVGMVLADGPARVQRERPRGVDVGEDLGELVRDALEPSDRLPELLAL